MPDSHTTLLSHSWPSGRAFVRGTLVAIVAVAALTSLPALAVAAPPDNNDYYGSIPVNDRGTPLPTYSDFSYTTAEADLQADIFNGNPGGPFVEPDRCRVSDAVFVDYDNTVWWDVYPHRPGNLTVVVRSSSFAPVVGVMPFDLAAPQRPNLAESHCDSAGGLGQVTLNYRFRLKEGGNYTTQIGVPVGGTPGDYDVFFLFDPDSDRDGLVDSGDQCPQEIGGADLGGCPDADGDKIANRNDVCPTLAGGANFGGCPDADKDGIPEGGQDHCEGLNPARVNRDDKKPRDGCPDILRNPAAVATSATDVVNGVPLNGVLFNDFVIKRVPKGARVVVKCKLPSGRRCGGRFVKQAAAAAGAPVRARAARDIPVPKVTGKPLPFGTTITVRVTAPYATGRFIRIKVVRPSVDSDRVAERKFCMRVNSNKLRKGGCV
jgi:hypothetical protein